MKINSKIKNFKKILLASLLLATLISFFYNCKKTPTTPELPSYGSIQVNSTPTGSTIWLDGSNTGKTTNALLTNISVGSHTIKLTKDCYNDFEITVSVQENQTEIVDTTLEESFSESGYSVSGIVYYSITPLNGIKVELEKGSATGQHKKNSKSPYVFLNPKTAKPLKDVKRVFPGACKRAGIKIRFQDLRHTFASRLVQSGVDLITVKDLCGHSSVKVTERYTHSNEDLKREAVEILGQNQAKMAPKEANLLHNRDTDKSPQIKDSATDSFLTH